MDAVAIPLQKLRYQHLVSLLVLHCPPVQMGNITLVTMSVLTVLTNTAQPVMHTLALVICVKLHLLCQVDHVLAQVLNT